MKQSSESFDDGGADGEVVVFLSIVSGSLPTRGLPVIPGTVTVSVSTVTLEVVETPASAEGKLS